MGSMLTKLFCKSPEFKFEQLCQDACHADDILHITNAYKIEYKRIYNDYIGWALPNRETCELIVQVWKQNPGKNIIDLGAGTGVFCMVLHHLGIPAKHLIAFDQEELPYNSEKSKTFWPIVNADNWDVNPHKDILFIAWGVDTLEPIVQKYIHDGGTCIIILGESCFDATFPWNYFNCKDEDCPWPLSCLIDQSQWKSNIHSVIKCSASQSMERLSINVCKTKNKE